MGQCASATSPIIIPIQVQSTQGSAPQQSKRSTPQSQNTVHPITSNNSSKRSTNSSYIPNPANILLNNRYELLPGLLGKGHFAKVKKCIDITTGILYACKIIDKKELLKSSTIVKQEIDILKQVGQHRHIVALIDTYENQKHFFLIIEYCAGGDLFTKIIDIGKFTESHASHVCNQLATALQYIHSKNVVHRDLKPENILLTNDNTEEFEIKIADFGLAKLMKNQLNTMKTVCGTWAYCAPEVITRQPYNSTVDNWTLGVLMYILLSGYHPFDVYGELSEPELLQKIISVQYDFDDPVWQNVSTEAKALIQKLLIFEPKQRLSLTEYLQNPWVKHSVGASNDTNNAIIAERLQNLTGGKTGLKAIVLAKLASQKFKASVNSKNTEPKDNMFSGINSIVKRDDTAKAANSTLLVTSTNNRVTG